MVIFICLFYVYEMFYESSNFYEDGLGGLCIASKETDKIHERFFFKKCLRLRGLCNGTTV